MLSLPSAMKAYIYDKKSDGHMRFEENYSTQGVKAQDKVILKVKAAGINPIDYKVVKMPIFNAEAKPVGNDVCGEVVDAPADSGFKAGDLVWGHAGMMGNKGTGAIAEYAAGKAENLVKVPAGGSAKEYGGLAIALVTIACGYDRAGFRTAEDAKGKTAMIIGASGGTGSFGVQWAAKVLKFEKVIAVCSAKNAEMVKSLGATEVVDYSKGSLDTQVDLASVDHVFDCVSSPDDRDYTEEATKLLRPNGGATGKGGFLSQINTAKGHWFMLALIPRWLGEFTKERMERCTEAMRSGQIKLANIDAKPFTPEGCKAAFDAVKSRRAIGKVVITM